MSGPSRREDGDGSGKGWTTWGSRAYWSHSTRNQPFLQFEGVGSTVSFVSCPGSLGESSDPGRVSNKSTPLTPLSTSQRVLVCPTPTVSFRTLCLEDERFGRDVDTL